MKEPPEPALSCLVLGEQPSAEQGRPRAPRKVPVRLPEQGGGQLCPLTPAGPLSLPRAVPSPYTLTTGPRTGPTPVSPKASRPGFPLRREGGRGSGQITPEIRSPRKQRAGWLASPCPGQDQQHLSHSRRCSSDLSASPGAAGCQRSRQTLLGPLALLSQRHALRTLPGGTHTRGSQTAPLHALVPSSRHAAVSALCPDGLFISATRSPVRGIRWLIRSCSVSRRKGSDMRFI